MKGAIPFSVDGKATGKKRPLTDSNIKTAVAAWLHDSTRAETEYGQISVWDVGQITLMANLFSDASSFTSDLAAWNVSKVNTMAGMFSNASSFTSDLAAWDVSEVNSMANMFSGATSFNSDLSNWDVSKVTDVKFLFKDAGKFSATPCGTGTMFVNGL